MKIELKCHDCCYYWKEDWETFAGCHWTERCPDDKAPCEYDESDYYGNDGDYEVDWDEFENVQDEFIDQLGG